jgi:PAS domain S-box-containing protein
VAAAILTAAIVLSDHVHHLALLLLGVAALWLLFNLVLERPFRELVEGTKQIAAHHLDFRFDRKHSSELGDLEDSINTITSMIQGSQEELRDTKEYLEGIIENSADMIITVNSVGVIETFNHGGEELLGYHREEMIGKRIESLYVDPRERHIAVTMLEESGHVKNYETRLRTKDGQVCDILLTLSWMRDSSGTPIGTIGISKDITHEKKLLDELSDAKEYLEGMVEHSADIIVTVNSEGTIETFNRGGEEALGYCRDEVIGQPVESLYVDPRDRYTAAALLEKTGNVINYETRLLAKDSQVHNVLLTLSPLRDSDGKSIGTIGISKDITQEKRLQRELIQAQKFAAIGQAVTGIQHSIKNMLNALKGGAY